MRGALLAALGATVAMCGSAAAASAPDSAVRFVYDDAGQLKAVTDPATQTAAFSWDPAGNLLSIARLPSSQLSILKATPA